MHSTGGQSLTQSLSSSPAEDQAFEIVNSLNSINVLKAANDFKTFNNSSDTNSSVNGNHANGVNGSNGAKKLKFSDEEDPICIVGMACRLPGGIRSPSDLWDFLAQNKSAQGPVPTKRFNIKAFYHPDGSRAGVMDADGGYFLEEDVREFENSFFGINNLEATYMDPQQRKLLEVVFECFESAGLSMDHISGTNTGVYVGNFTVDYQTMQTRDPDYMHRYNATGSGTAIMSNRISHVFNLQGPSLTIDTACSSSIYCLHSAVNAIKAGECDGAIVAGANLITAPEQHLGTMKGGVLSPTSTCHTFDASADGYGRAEAVNAVYLKPLSSALRDGDKIWSVIRGTAINSNGRTPGITQPSAQLQEVVIRKAYANAGLHFDETDYIECHGTGTAVGDPIEVEGLQNCFGPRERPLKIGSVKSNLGHSEAASGLTSLIKVALSFHNGKIPPTYGLKKLNPKLKLERANMNVVVEVEEWPRDIRRASINSFGYGGANAHAIVESIDSYFNKMPQVPRVEVASRDHLMVLPISAASNKSLEARCKQIKETVGRNANSIKSIAFTLAQHRPTLRSKGILLAKIGVDGKAELVQSELSETIDSKSMNLPFAFILTGQGSQYPGMGKELLKNNESFLYTIRELDDILQKLPAKTAPTWTLEQTILDPPELSQINHVTRSQPICTAIQIGIINLLRNWGITPTAVVGHSSGEIAAAYAAGLLNTKESILAAYFRGYAVGKLPSHCEGTMVAAGIGHEVAKELIKEKGLQDEICVACINSPESVTLSGSREGAEILLAQLQANSKFARKLETGGRAYHSHLVKEVGGLYESLLAPHLKENPSILNSNVRMYSSVGYEGAESLYLANQARNARYWRDNLEKSVQFSSALEALIGDGKLHLIEIGSHPALKGPVQQIRAAANVDKNLLPYSSTFVRDRDSDLCIKKLAGSLYQHGHSLQWQNVNVMSPQDQVVLHNIPPYPWNYSAGLLWSEPRPSVELRNRQHPRHELLGSSQLAGNGIDFTWRNLLRVNEASWLFDHKIESQTVFPAVGYLAMAIEAISQVQDLKSPLTGMFIKTNISFEFRNVSISKALVIQDEADASAKDSELHTSLSWRKLSTTSKSADWCDFSVSSWTTGQATLHCSGNIRVGGLLLPKGTAEVLNTERFDTWPMDRWYNKLAEEGLCFGPGFQSLTSLRTDNNRVRTDALSTTNLKTKVGKATDTEYPVHPITIDACLQAAIMGGTGGNLNTLKAYLPVFISECRIQALGQANDEEAIIHTQSTKTGFATKRIDLTLLGPSGMPIIDMKDVRLSLYTGKLEQGETSNKLQLQRHPILRVNWKPDILRLYSGSESQLDKYVGDFIRRQQPDVADNETQVVVGALLDLIGHNNPRMRVLELEPECPCSPKNWLSLLNKETALPRIRSWNSGNLAESGELTINKGTLGPFDALLIGKLSESELLWKRVPEQLISLVGPHGVIITRKTDNAQASLAAAGFTVVEIRKQIILAVRRSKAKSLQGKDVLIVSNKPSPTVTAFASSLSGFLKETAGVAQVHNVSLASLPEVAISPKMVCISLLELEREFLATMSPKDMDLLRTITDVVTNLLWLSGANMLTNPDPNLTLSSGLSRAIMLEQPSLRFSVLDVGLVEPLAQLSTFENVERALASYEDIDDKEFIQVDGLLYTSRFEPDFGINYQFRRRMGEQDPIEKVPLSLIGPARLAIGRLGITDTLHFQQIHEVSTGPPVGFIDVAIKAVSLNAKDIYTISGHVETKTGTSALEFCGVVTAVGPKVDNLEIGDRVVVMAPNNFTTTERVPAWAAHKMLPGEEDGVLCTIPIAYATALYALHDRGHLRAGESILIHAGAGAFGTAAIILSMRVGATVYTTTSVQSKRDYLTNELGVPAANIFNSRDTSFVEGIKAATNGRGVDLVINSLIGDMMHASWDCLANFGRFVEIGKRELTDAGKLEMHMFLRNTTFTAFDLSELFYHEDQFYRNTWIRLTKEALELYRSGQAKPGPIATFDVSEISKAFRYFSAKDRIGKVVVSLENPDSHVSVAPAKYLTVLDPEKVYLLVGCLGGLGRSLSRWMMARGAKYFVFVGRSGCDKASAQELISRLKSTGAHVTVVRGDVSQADHVTAAVEACKATGKPIGGVIQAAMGLHEALFSRMSNEGWHTGIQPKWQGTWNLHNALEGHDDALDFFLLTSSVSGSVATATESNYCSANGFLDAFARWRRTQGKKAISVGLGMISEVGYLHENPEIEALLLRKGIQPLNEEEFLQVIDLSLSGEGGEYEAQAPNPDCSHMLTGLEPLALRKLIEKGWDVTTGNMQDPRSAILSASLLADLEGGDEKSNPQAGQANYPAWLKEIPTSVAKALASEADATSLQEAALRVTRKRFSSAILMPVDQIDEHKGLAEFGMDSMIAAEFRTWIWGIFKVDVPFLDLLSKQKSLANLVEFIEEHLKEV